MIDDLLPVIRARVRRRLGGRVPEGEIADVVQEVWVSLVSEGGRELRRYDPARGASLANYVGLIAEREAGNYLAALLAKKRGAGVQLVQAEEAEAMPHQGASPESALGDRQVLEQLVQHLEVELSAKGRAVFRSVYCDERSVDETAGALGVTAQVVYNWQHKIRALARAFLKTSEL